MWDWITIVLLCGNVIGWGWLVYFVCKCAQQADELQQWEFGFACYRRAVDKGNEDFERALQHLHKLLDKKVEKAQWN